MHKVPRLHRRCQCCNKLIELYPKDIARGKGLYCNVCVQKCRHIPTYDLICKTCNQPFKSTDNKDNYCSEECKDQ